MTFEIFVMTIDYIKWLEQSRQQEINTVWTI